MTLNLRDSAVVVLFELFEGLRSRKTLVLLFLFAAGSAGGAGMFINFVEAVKANIETQSGRAASEVLSSAAENPEIRQFLAEFVGDAEIVDALLKIPVLALFYGAAALIFTPLLVILSSSDAISGELSSGSSRFILFRTDRLSWALGKWGGQALILGVGLLLGGLATWVVGLIWYEGMDKWSTLWWIERLAGRAWFYGLAYLGIALAMSQLTRSVYIAIGLGLVALAGFALVGLILETPWMQGKLGVVGKVLVWFFPRGHDLDLWHPSSFKRVLTYGSLLVLSLGYFALGHLRFARRDV